MIGLAKDFRVIESKDAEGEGGPDWVVFLIGETAHVGVEEDLDVIGCGFGSPPLAVRRSWMLRGTLGGRTCGILLPESGLWGGA